MTTEPGILSDAQYPISADPFATTLGAAACQCLTTANQIQPQLTRLLYSTRTALDGFDAAQRASRGLDWTGAAATFFRADVESLTWQSALINERLETVRRALAAG